MQLLVISKLFLRLSHQDTGLIWGLKSVPESVYEEARRQSQA